MALHLLYSLAGSLLLTLLIEVSFALIWGVRRQLWMIVLMNIITNPTVVTLHFLIANYTAWNLPVCIFLLETAAVAVEARLCRVLLPHPWLFALCINLVSFGIGCLL